MTATLYNLDALTLLDLLDPGSVDAIITDLPYGTTACSWDEIIPFAPMWAGVKRVLKPRGAFVTTASQPFTSKLIMSNLEWFRYELIWRKSRPVGFLNAKIMPLKDIENVLIFSSCNTTYNPQNIERKTKRQKNSMSKTNRAGIGVSSHNGGRLSDFYLQEFTGYPGQLLEFPNEKTDHPTQKPVALYEYLIKTYTNPGETVLDFTMGSGTTGVACIQTGRNFIGVEMDAKYFEIAKRRIEAAQPPLFVEQPAQRQDENITQAALLC